MTALCAWLVAAVAQAQLVADGLFDDWSSSAPGVTDAAGDSTGTIDLLGASAQTQGTDLFLRVDVGTQQPISVVRSGAGSLVILVQMPAGTLRLSTTTREATLNGQVLNWNSLGTIGPTHDAREYEMQIHLGLAGAQAGDAVHVTFAGADSLDTPIELDLSTPMPVPPRRSTARPAGTQFRLAAYNVENTGLFKTGQGDAQTRLLRSVNADVYCLSELKKVTGSFNATEAELAARLTAIDPAGDHATWNALLCPFPRNGSYADTAICSASAIVAAPPINAQCTAGFVLLPSGTVLVISVHPKCCNDAGTEDGKRLQTMQEIATAIERLRAGTWDASAVAYADVPVVVAGDWNLVGNPQPLQLLTNSTTEPMIDSMPRHLIGSEVTTCGHRSTSYANAFMPSRIDLVVHSRSLEAAHGFVLNPRGCNESELAVLQLMATDGDASDHLPVVVDFGARTGRTSDLDGNGVVDFGDVALIMLDFGPCAGCPSDLDANGLVDFGDVAVALLDFGPTG